MKKIYLIVLIFIPLSLFCQTEEADWSYSPELDSYMFEFYNCDYDNNDSCKEGKTCFTAYNNRKIKKQDVNIDIKFFSFIGCKFKDLTELNKFPNLIYLRAITKRAIYDDIYYEGEIEISNLKFAILQNDVLYRRVPEFIVNQKGLLGLNIGVDSLDVLLNSLDKCKELRVLYISLIGMQDIPLSIANFTNLCELEFYTYAENNDGWLFKCEDENILLPDNFHELENLKSFRAPIDLGINYSELLKLPNLIDLSVKFCSISEFKDLNKLMDKLVILNIKKITDDELKELRTMYPNVRINESILTREEAYNMGLISQP